MQTLSLKETARRLRCSPACVSRAIKRGRIEGTKKFAGTIPYWEVDWRSARQFKPMNVGRRASKR